MKTGRWVQELPAEIMVCDRGGTILEMNDGAEELFHEDGGRKLMGSNVLACHPREAREKLETMMSKESRNAYFNTDQDGKRFFFQSPWYQEGAYAGFVEISFAVPEVLPHFDRG